MSNLTPELNVEYIQRKLIGESTNRKQLINVLRGVIREKRKVQRQITRKYENYQAIENYQELLKRRIKQLTVFSL